MKITKEVDLNNPFINSFTILLDKPFVLDSDDWKITYLEFNQFGPLHSKENLFTVNKDNYSTYNKWLTDHGFYITSTRNPNELKISICAKGIDTILDPPVEKGFYSGQLTIQNGEDIGTIGVTTLPNVITSKPMLLSNTDKEINPRLSGNNASARMDFEFDENAKELSDNYLYLSSATPQWVIKTSAINPIELNSTYQFVSAASNITNDYTDEVFDLKTTYTLMYPSKEITITADIKTNVAITEYTQYLNPEELSNARNKSTISFTYEEIE